MQQPFPNALAIDKSIADAKRAVDREPPFSPAWDAAMAVLEDAERARWQLENEVSDATAAIAASSEEPVTRVTV
jgi:hypothetical protein